MIDGIPGGWVVQGGAVGVLVFVALLIFTGRLIPRSVFKQLERDRDYWRAAALKSIGHTEALMPAAEITTQFTKELYDATAKAVSDATSSAFQRALGGDPEPGRKGPP